MKKITLLLVSLLFLFFLSACSDKGVSPNERFEDYVKNWNKQNFDKMYTMLAEETTKKYKTEQFSDRYVKIYEDLEVDKLDVSYKKLTEEQVKKAMDEGVATIPFTVKMESMAGPISFDYEAELVQQGEDKEKNWFIKWNPGYIFPEMKDGGKLNIDVTEPKRGEILDRNQMPLAINDMVWEIGIVPEKLGDNSAAKEQIARLLNMSVEQIDNELNADWVKPDLFVPLKKVPETNEAVLNELWGIPGVGGREVTGRVYPLGEAAAHLVGYIGQITAEELAEKDSSIYSSSDMIGKRGLEQLLEEQLKGKKGVKITITKESTEEDIDDGEENYNEVILAEKPVEDGENITVTIDANVQEKVYKSYDSIAGTAAVIQPKTGETLALVSSPAFDPNELMYGISQSRWDELEKNKQQPLLNRFSATYAPGSVMKSISAAVGLKNGSINPDEGIEINGLEWSNGKGWGDYKVRRVSTSNGPVDLADAIIRSDNIYFAMKAVDMGSKAYVEGLQDFGFGEKLPYTYPITASSISSTGKLDDEVLLANTSYGQGEVQISSLHLATAYSIFLNDGNMIKPILLSSEEKGETWKKGLITKDQAKVMQKALREVVTKGTAKKAQSAKFPISGKTGTAELKLTAEKGGDENGWFVAYPTDDKDLIIAMMMEKVQDKGASNLVVEKVTDILSDIKK